MQFVKIKQTKVFILVLSCGGALSCPVVSCGRRRRVCLVLPAQSIKYLFAWRQNKRIVRTRGQAGHNQQKLKFHERCKRTTRGRRAERADRGVNNQVKEYYYFFCDLFLTCFVNIKITATYQGHQSYISQVYNHDLTVTFATLTHRIWPFEENLTLKRTKNKEI